MELSKCSTSDYIVNADTDKDRFETVSVISFGYSGLGAIDRAVEIDTKFISLFKLLELLFGWTAGRRKVF